MRPLPFLCLGTEELGSLRSSGCLSSMPSLDGALGSLTHEWGPKDRQRSEADAEKLHAREPCLLALRVQMTSSALPNTCCASGELQAPLLYRGAPHFALRRLSDVIHAPVDFSHSSSSSFRTQRAEKEPGRDMAFAGGSTLFVDYKNVSSFGQLLESIFVVLRLSSNAQ